MQPILVNTWHPSLSKIYLILHRIYHIIENDIKLSKSYLSDHFKSFSVSRYYTVHKREKKKHYNVANVNFDAITEGVIAETKLSFT